MSLDPTSPPYGEPPINPYAPPQSVSAPPTEPEDGEWVDASKVARALNFVVDAVARALILFVWNKVSAHDPSGLGVSLLRQVVVDFTYCVCLEFLFGVTLGKLFTGTRVVAVDGSRPSLTAVIVRTLVRLLPFEPLSFLFGGGPPRGWHDTMSSTRVVYGLP